MKRFLLIVLALALTFATFGVAASAATYDTYKVYYNGKNTGYTGCYVKGTPYLPASIINDGKSFAQNAAVTVDKKNMVLKIDVSAMNLLMADEETTDFVKKNAGVCTLQLKNLDGVVSFPLNSTAQFFKVSWDFNGSINIYPLTGATTIARVKTSSASAVASLLSDSARTSAGESIKLAANQQIYILDGGSANFYKFRTASGDVGYIEKNDVTVEEVDLKTVDFFAPKKTPDTSSYGENIGLAWVSASSVTIAAPEKFEGLDVLAPTWFHLKVEEGGDVKNTGDRGFSDLCHENGYQVWATATNSMTATGSTNFTSKMFTDSAIADRAIAQYIFYACLYDSDGLNIDFETLKDSDRDGFTAFTKKLCSYAKRQGLVTSVDVPPPASWYVEYDYGALASIVDYVALMAYDEHYSGSTVAGSVASLPWVEKGLKNTLSEGVPAKKFLLGAPAYTRVWSINSAGKIVSRSAVSMSWVAGRISSGDVSVTYDSSTGQNFAQYTDSAGNTCKIWIEDETSMTARAALAKKYGLAGVAVWQYSQAAENIWPLLK